MKKTKQIEGLKKALEEAIHIMLDIQYWPSDMGRVEDFEKKVRDRLLYDNGKVNHE